MLFIFIAIIFFNTAYAVETNITPTSGTGNLNTIVTPNGNNYEISGGEQQGSNLFHSFQDFSISSGDTGKFINNNGASISNILSRVTGGNISEINGNINSLAFPNANFYFINPAGILFGADASLNVAGSFHVSTADYLKLGDLKNGAKFYADPSRQNILLSSAAPSAFGFLQERPAGISFNHSSLKVKNGETLSVTSGDINLKGGRLTAAAGTLILNSVQSSGEHPFPSNINHTSLTSGADISLSENSKLNTSGIGGGNIVIRGGKLVIDNSTITSETQGEDNGQGIDIMILEKIEVKNDSNIEASTSGTGNGGQITVQTPNLLLQGGRINANTTGDGQGGTIIINAETITMIQDAEQNRARITAATTNGSGDAGNVQLNVSTLTIADDNLVGTFGRPSATGNAGDIKVEADEVYLIRGGRLTATSSNAGNSGNITVNSNKLISLKDVHYYGDGKFDFIAAGLFSDSEGSGDANGGKINVSTPLLKLEGGKIGASINVSGNGSGGEININATQISIYADNIGNAAQITVTTKGSGNAGAISIQTDQLSIADFSIIGATTRGSATGNAGDINVQAKQISINSGGFLSTRSSGDGLGGNIHITASQSIKLQGVYVDQDGDIHASGINSNARGAGNGGQIFINTPQLTLEGGEIVANSTRNGLGGEITLQTEQLQLRADANGNPASIIVSSTGSGDAGNINILSTNLLIDNSHISATSKGQSVKALGSENNLVNTVQSDGGNIQLSINDVLQLLGSEITTQVEAGNGNGGNISINGGLVVLDNSEIIADAFQGNGGNINITADAFFKSPDSLISASSELGFDGDIIIDSPVTDIISSIQLLPSNFLDVDSILSTPCTQRSEADTSYLVIRNYEVLPDSPYGLQTLPSKSQQSTPQGLAPAHIGQGC